MFTNLKPHRRGILLGAASTALGAAIGLPALAQDKVLKVNLVIPGTDSDYWGRYTVAGARQGALDAATAFGREIEFRSTGPATEGAQQDFLQQLEGVVASRPDAVILGSLYAEPTRPILEAAAAQGTRVNLLAIPVEGLADDAFGSLYYCDQPEQGVKMADFLVEYCQSRKIEMTGKVGIHMSVVIPVLEDKINAFRARMAELAPDLELLDTLYNDNDPVRATQNIEGQLARNGGKIFALAGFNAICGSAIARVLAEAGLQGKVLGISTDSDADEIAGLRGGAMQALILQTPFDQAYHAVHDAVDHIVNGTTFDKGINITSVVATPENMDSDDIAKLLVPPQ
ncbi:MAG: sugar ABC transporter substrate-binding protein [Tropicimonas sp.]|uniref:sugar ABC transporter substrate-binding protein n=1 Tax=Tropicimonas sp. TaxID=2067044 RepID=UPI003A84B138